MTLGYLLQSYLDPPRAENSIESRQSVLSFMRKAGLPGRRSRVVAGTTSTYPGATTFAHWTAGCHGTTGLLRNVLRAVNVPVQILRVCGHGQVHVLTEGTYLDHADNPYNLGFKASGLRPRTS